VIRLETIDAHVGGEPLRLIVDGFPSPRGKTMAEKRAWAAAHADHLRRVVMLEPRGHRDMRGAVLTEPVTPGSHAGLLIMHGSGYASMSGHAIVGAVTIALERNLLLPGGDSDAVAIDTPAGTVRARVERADGHVTRVTFVNVPSFVLHGGIEARLGARTLRADVAFGGALYAIVDGESAGLALDGAHAAELRRTGVEAARAVERALATHPDTARTSEIAGTIFIGPPQGESADLRNVTVFSDGALNRCASGTGTAAVMAVLDAMGLLDDSRWFVQESVIGTTMRGRVVHRTVIDDRAAIVPEIEAAACITGEHVFLVHDDDTLGGGFEF
jgi:proline racemase